MSKIVILSGSARKDGNTELLANAFVEGARQNNTVEVVSVADYAVKPCIGCNSCFSRDGNGCFQNDDMQKVYKILADADVIVAASPVYFFGISAQLKAIIDRLHTPLRNSFKVKKSGLLLVAASSKPRAFEAIKAQYRSILDYFNLEDIGIVTVNSVKERGDIIGRKELQDAYEMGKNIK